MDGRRILFTVRRNAQSGRCLVSRANVAYPMFETAYDCLVGRCSSDKYYNKLE